MSQQLSRQIALMTVLTTCVVVVALALGAGYDVDAGVAMSQVVPLALVLAAALTFLLAEPSSSR